MKKKISWITVFAVIAVAIILNVLLFSVLPEKVQNYPAFWYIWAFTFPVNVIFAIVLAVYANLKDGIMFLRIPICYYVAWTFTVLYFTIGFKLMFVNFAKDKIGIPIAIELAITLAYALALALSFLGVSYVEHNQRLVKKKVFYIRDLKTDVDSCLSYVSDSALKKQLEKLSEAIRYSDPMSHASLADIEAELAGVIRSIVVDACSEGSVEEISSKAKKAMALLEYRNNKCLILK